MLLPIILAHFPKQFRSYHEPFLGGGSVFLALGPTEARLNDANSELVDVYRSARDDPQGLLIALAALQPHVQDRGFYYELRSRHPNCMGLPERSARFIFLNRTGYNGLYRVNRAGQFNVPFGERAAPPRLVDPANLCHVSALLQHAEVTMGDFESALDRAERGDVVYADPPYVPVSRTAKFTAYTRDSFGLDDQERLAACVRRAAARGALVVVSNSDQPEVRRMYSGFKLIEVQVPRRINSDGAGRSTVGELIVVASGEASTAEVQ